MSIMGVSVGTVMYNNTGYEKTLWYKNSSWLWDSRKMGLDVPGD